MENEITYFEYWKEVRELADSIVSKEDYSDDADINDILWERIDSHNWIIYNYLVFGTFQIFKYFILVIQSHFIFRHHRHLPIFDAHTALPKKEILPASA